MAPALGELDIGAAGGRRRRSGWCCKRNSPGRGHKWLWILPLGWLGWQFVSATETVDADLTAATLWQLSGCVACYFLGVFLFASRRARNWLLMGILAAFTFCLVRAVDQKLFEFPVNYQMLVEGEHSGWTNFPPETITEMKRETSSSTPMAWTWRTRSSSKNSQKGRVAGTLVYPNALAGLILLLWPVSLALAFGATKPLKPPIRMAAIGLAVFLGGAAFFWTGSKLGWLIGIGVAGLFICCGWTGRSKLKLAAVAAVLILGLGVFAMRFHDYFSAGATSVGARFDYWRAAVQTTIDQPALRQRAGDFSAALRPAQIARCGNGPADAQ